MNRSATFLAVALAAGIVAPVFAQDGFAPNGIKAIDTDGDGAISRTEATATLHQQFARLDRNHDGAISEDELVAARMEQFTQADADSDGKLTRAELRKRFLEMRQH